jgi:hypothetical protein
MYKKKLAIWNKKKQKFSEEKTKTLLRAVQKIKLTVYFVYENQLVEKEISKIRKRFNIPDNLFEKYNIECSSTFILGLWSQAMQKWREDIIKVKNAKADIALEKYVRENKRLDSLNPKYINDRLWIIIILVKLFEIPPKKVLNCISNLLDFYFPKVNNDLLVQFYPSTTEEELKFIWDDIQKIQQNRISNLLIRRKFEYPMHDADKEAYELKQTTKMKNKDIAEKITEKKLLPKNITTYTYVEVGKSLRRYKKFIELNYS